MTNVNITTLSNGFRVVSKHLPHTEAVTLGVWVNAGSRNEDISNNGVAHFLEHMAFKGTPTRTAYQISKEVEEVGGYLNAYTSREMTAYYARVLKQHTPVALDIISDILLNPTFPEEEMEKERQVILQEIGLTNDTPDDIVFDYFQEQCYKDQALGRSILGPADNIIHMRKDTLMNFMQRFYTPENMVLSAAGDVDHDELVKHAEATFGKLSKGAAQAAQVKPEFTGGAQFEERELEQLHIVMGFQGVHALSIYYYPFHLFSTLLGDGMSSRLFQQVREKLGLVYSISSFNMNYADSGQFAIYAGTSPERVSELFPAIASEMRTLSLEITEDDAQKAKNILTARLMMGLESTSNWTTKMARQLLTFGEVKPLEQLKTEINQVNCEQIMGAGMSLMKAPIALATIGNNQNVSSYEDICRLFR